MKKASICLRCGSHRIVKNGKIGEAQKFKCNECGYQFLTEKSNYKELDLKLLAILLYLKGFSVSFIAKILKVSSPAVLKWIKAFEKHYKTKLIAKRVKKLSLKKRRFIDTLTLKINDSSFDLHI